MPIEGVFDGELVFVVAKRLNEPYRPGDEAG
jgi:hypothetical protein